MFSTAIDYKLIALIASCRLLLLFGGDDFPLACFKLLWSSLMMMIDDPPWKLKVGDFIVFVSVFNVFIGKGQPQIDFRQNWGQQPPTAVTSAAQVTITSVLFRVVTPYQQLSASIHITHREKWGKKSRRRSTRQKKNKKTFNFSHYARILLRLVLLLLRCFHAFQQHQKVYFTL
jgi:hypothetical protein